jgi:predicted PurR-regulated permease PerM
MTNKPTPPEIMHNNPRSGEVTNNDPIWERLLGFGSSMIVLGFALGGINALGMWLIFGGWLAPIVGGFGGGLAIIPIFGSLLGMALMACYAVLAIGATAFWPYVLLIILFIAGWWLENFVLGPKIVGENVGLRPFYVLLGTLAGALLGGIIGAFIAVPVMIIVTELWQRYKAKQTPQP